MTFLGEFLYPSARKMEVTKTQFCLPPLTPPTSIGTKTGAVGTGGAKIVVLVYLLFMNLFSVANDSLQVVIPKNEELFKSLGEYYTELTASEIAQYTYVEKWKWLQYAPSFGWNFVQNTPYIGWNSNDLFNAINAKRAKKAHLEGIFRAKNIEFDAKCKEIVLKTHVFYAKKRVFDTKKALFDLKTAYFGIFEEKYEKHELEPSIFLQKSIDYENFKLEIEKLRFELVKIQVDILQTAYFGDQNVLFTDLDHFLDE